MAIEASPAVALYHSNLGEVLRAMGEIDQAIMSFKRAIALQPDYPHALVNLSSALEAAGQLDEAMEAARKAIALRPDAAEAWCNLANVLQRRGELQEAVEHYRKSIELRPGAVALNNLGLALKSLGRVEDAAECFRRAASLEPQSAAPHANLAAALAQLGRLTQAEQSCRLALALGPTGADILCTLGHILHNQGRVDEAIEAFRQAVAHNAAHAQAHSNVLLMLNYSEKLGAGAIYREHRGWAQLHACPIPPCAYHANDRDPNRILRIGLVSADFKEHPIAFFIEPVLRGLDRGQFEVFCYSDVAAADAATARLRDQADVWHDTHALDNQALAQRIAADSIDILVDLAGHTAANRLPVFAGRPAPVQITYLGYPNTTGMDAMDGWISDVHLDPPERSTPASERIIRLPDTFACYQPRGDAPAVAESPVLDSGRVTFGSFNHIAKLNDAVVLAWARILNLLPDAKLLLKDRSLGDHGVRQRLLGRFISQGTRAEQILMEPSDPLVRHLESYGRVDLMLDPFPFNGHTTSLHGLWMGVPLIALEGQTHVSRRGLMILQNLQQTELVAPTAEDYVRIAVELARDPLRLADLRRGMRNRLASCPLTDQPRFLCYLQSALRGIWREWCIRPEPDRR